jgi:hypothetical protein
MSYEVTFRVPKEKEFLQYFLNEIHKSVRPADSVPTRLQKFTTYKLSVRYQNTTIPRNISHLLIMTPVQRKRNMYPYTFVYKVRKVAIEERNNFDNLN